MTMAPTTIPPSVQPGSGRSIPFALPDIGDAEVEAVERVLRSGWLTTGPEVQAFQKEFAEAVAAPYAVAVNSCTAALHLALEALGVGEGDEILVPTVTFTATAEVAEYLGARSRFVDIDPQTLCMDPATVGQYIAENYRRIDGAWRHRESGGRLAAIVPVHFAGHPCDMPALMRLSVELGVPIVDDAAHTLPAAVDGVGIGAFACSTAFSFYATKTMTTGEGGMLTTHDPAIAERARVMSLHGISGQAWKRYTNQGSWYYEVMAPGFKYNLTDMAAALGRAQLRRIQQMGARRRAIAAAYHAALSELETLQIPSSDARVEHSWHLYVLRLHLHRLTIERNAFIDELRARGVGTSVHFIPLHRQPFYATTYKYDPADFPVAEREYSRILSIPIYSAMTDADVEHVIAAVTEVATEFARAT